MNFIGSKDRLLAPLLDRAIAEVGIEPGRFGDAFAGTHIVGRHFQSRGWEVFANDWQAFSACLGHAMLMSEPAAFEGVAGELFPSTMVAENRLPALIDHLNLISDAPLNFWREELFGSWFINAYCERGSAGGPDGNLQEIGGDRLYFSTSNGAAIQSIREGIDQMTILPNEKGQLIASLIFAADKVANTASVYAAYLKAVKASARKALRLKPFGLTVGPNATITNLDALDYIKATPGLRVLYIDPPYNHRQYAPNYHILETIARWDRPQPRGKTGVRPYDDLKSRWCSKKTVASELRAVAEAAQADYLLFSYSNEGLLSYDQIMMILSDFGKVTVFSTDLKRFRSDSDSQTRIYKGDSVIEYLFVLEKS